MRITKEQLWQSRLAGGGSGTFTHMVMLSDVVRCAVVDAGGRRARVADLVIELAAGDHPPVVDLLVPGEAGTLSALPWTSVTADWHRRRLHVEDLRSARPLSDDEVAQRVLLKRDVMDALVLDLANRQSTRANDLWLSDEGGTLRLVGADVGAMAVLRRLVRGWLGHGDHPPQHLLDWKDVEFLRGDPQAAREGRDYHRRVVQLQPGELARLLDAVPYLHAAELLTLIPDPAAADTLEAMSPERQLQVFEELDAGQAERLLALMAPEAATDLLGRLTPGDARRHLERLPEERRQRLLDLLRYPDDTAGGIMTNEIVVAPAAMTVGEARRALKAQLEAPDFVYYVYVVDSLEEGHLKGVLTLRQMVLANDDARLDTLMQPHLISIDPLEPAAAAARRVAENDLAALPVVSRDGRLLGAITADAAVAQIAPPAWREVAPRVFS